MTGELKTLVRGQTLNGIGIRPAFLGLFVIVTIGWIPALVGLDALGSASALYSLASSASPYYVPGHAGTLYLWTPLVVASACLLLMSPGLYLSLALDAAKSVGQWVLNGLALSILLLSLATAVLQAIRGAPIRSEAFVSVVVGCSVLSYGVLILRLLRGRVIDWPLDQPHAGFTTLSMVAVPVGMLIALSPKFYWENLNGDGAHAFESARLLLFQPLPFWSRSAGEIASFPGLTSLLFAYPASWFIRLFGEIEASARLPLLLYLAGLYAAILLLVEYGRIKPPGIAERLLIWLALAVYVVVISFSATYNPYFADIALPATQDTLFMVCFLGFIFYFLRNETPWMLLFIGLTFVSLPSGLLLIGLWLLATTAVWKPRPLRVTVQSAVALLGCLVLASVAPYILNLFGQPAPGREYGVIGLLRRFAFLQYSDWRRLLFMVVPGGILPATMLLAFVAGHARQL